VKAADRRRGLRQRRRLHDADAGGERERHDPRPARALARADQRPRHRRGFQERPDRDLPGLAARKRKHAHDNRCNRRQHDKDVVVEALSQIENEARQRIDLGALRVHHRRIARHHRVKQKPDREHACPDQEGRIGQRAGDVAADAILERQLTGGFLQHPVKLAAGLARAHQREHVGRIERHAARERVGDAVAAPQSTRGFAQAVRHRPCAQCRSDRFQRFQQFDAGAHHDRQLLQHQHALGDLGHTWPREAG